MASSADAAPAATDAPPAPSLADAPACTLALLLGMPGVELRDLGRAACVCRALRAAATAPALRQWAAVRVAGQLRWYPHKETFQDLAAILPLRGARLDAQGVFEEGAWAAALAEDADGDLKFDLHMNGPNSSIHGPAGRLQRRLEEEWAGMSAAERAPHEAAARGRREHQAAYDASCVPAAATSAPLLRALADRCRGGVHTLDVGREFSYYGGRDAPFSRIDGELLRRLGAAWGATLRIARLGNAAVSAEEVHEFVAACPGLVHLHLGRVSLPKGALGALFGDGMATHAALRSVALPPVRGSLGSLAGRLADRCPALREIDAESFDATRGDGADVVARVARAAAARGVRRFLCTSFFAGGGSDGEYGSDGGSVGEYCGDGDVLKYVGGARAW